MQIDENEETQIQTVSAKNHISSIPSQAKVNLSDRMQQINHPNLKKEPTFGLQEQKKLQKEVLTKHASPKLNQLQQLDSQQMRIFEQSPVQENFPGSKLSQHSRVKSTGGGAQLPKQVKASVSTKHKAQKSVNLSNAPLGDVTLTDVDTKQKLQKVRDFDTAYNAFANELISKGLQGQADDKQNLLVTDMSITKFMSNKSRPMTPVDKQSLHNRLYREALVMKQSRDMIYRPLAKLEEEVEQVCTFQPNLNTSVASQKRSKNQFLEDQFNFQQKKQQRLQELQEAKEKQLEENKRPQLIAKETNEKIVEKLRKQSPSLNQSAFSSKIQANFLENEAKQGFQTSNSQLRMQHRHQKSCGDLHQFKPQINKVSQAIYEEKFKDQRSVAQKLYEDAKRRQVSKHSRSPSADRSLPRMEYSNLMDGSSSMLQSQEGKARNPAASASVNHTSQIIVQTKFRNEFETSLQYAFRQTKDIKLPQNDKMLIQKETFFHLMNNMQLFPEQSNKNYLLEEIFELLTFNRTFALSPERSPERGPSPSKNSPAKIQPYKKQPEVPQDKYIDSQHVFTLLCAMFNLLDHSQTAQTIILKQDQSFVKKQFGYFSDKKDVYLIAQEEKQKIHNHFLPLILYRQEQHAKLKKPTQQQSINDFRPQLDPVSMQIVRNMSKSPHHSSDIQSARRMAARSRQEYLEDLSKTKENSVRSRIIIDEKKKKELKECTFKPKMQTSRRKGSPGFVPPGAHHRKIEEDSIENGINKNLAIIKELSKPRQRNHLKTSEEVEYEKSKDQLTFIPKLIARPQHRMNQSSASISHFYPEPSPDQKISRNNQDGSALRKSNNYSQKAKVKKSMEGQQFSKHHVPGQKSNENFSKPMKVKKLQKKQSPKEKQIKQPVEISQRYFGNQHETPLERVPELESSAASFSPLKQAHFTVESGTQGLRRSQLDLSEKITETFKEQPILCMDVRVSATEQDQLLIFKNDSISKVIQNFAKKHNLVESKVVKLREVIAQQLQ